MVPSRLTTSILLPSCSIPFIAPGGSSEMEHTLMRVPREVATDSCSASRTDRRRNFHSPALPRYTVIVQGLEGLVLPFPANSLLFSNCTHLTLFCVVFCDVLTVG